MLDPEPGECLQLPIVQLHRDVDDDFPAGLAQYLPKALVQFELLGSHIGPGYLRFPRIDFFLICSRHRDIRDGV